MDAIYQSKQASKLIFIGGTCLRLIYNNQRFSEDLDFDNLGLDRQEFSELIDFIKRFLNHEGFEVEMREVFKAAYHCYIKFPKILFELGLTK